MSGEEEEGKNQRLVGTRLGSTKSETATLSTRQCLVHSARLEQSGMHRQLSPSFSVQSRRLDAHTKTS